jgi:hypothetical protein
MSPEGHYNEKDLKGFNRDREESVEVKDWVSDPIIATITDDGEADDQGPELSPA